MHYSKALIQTKLYFCSLPFSSFSGRSQVRQNSNLPFSSTFPDFNEFSPDFPFNPVFDSNKVSPDPFPPNAYQPEPYPSEPYHSDRYTPGSSPVIKLRPEYHPEPAYQVSLHLLRLPAFQLFSPSNSHLHLRPLPMLLQCPPRSTERPPMHLPPPPTINQHPQPTTSQHPRPTTFPLDLCSLTSDPTR